MSGLYLHIPFCKQKCHYCDFHFSVSLRNKSELIQAMLTEMNLRKGEIREPLETIYLGGGTPSLLDEKELTAIFEQIHKQYAIANNPEVTLEANPDDVSVEKLKLFKKLGINRLSIGIQSFHDDELQMMNRVHTANEAKKCVLQAKEVCFENLTIDLIYGIPNSNPQKWQYNLDTFLELKIPHLSAYALTVEKKTALEHLIKTGKIRPVEEQLAQNQFVELRKFMLQNGFEHYELSNYARPGFYSRHNTSYWQNKPYLGIGPSAHSYDGKSRSWNIANNSRYSKLLKENILPLEREVLTIPNRYNEYLMTGLRTQWGIDRQKIANDFGKEFSDYLDKKSAKYFQNNDLKLVSGHHIVLTEKALFRMDGIISDLFWG